MYTIYTKMQYDIVYRYVCWHFRYYNHRYVSRDVNGILYSKLILREIQSPNINSAGLIKAWVEHIAKFRSMLTNIAHDLNY